MIALWAIFLPQLAWEGISASSAGVTLLGIWYAWQRQWHRADVEERLKDRKITEDQAHRQMRFIDVRAGLLIVGGMGLLILAMGNIV